MRARILTFNLGGLKDGWFEGRRESVIEGLKKLGPDVLCLQETTINRGTDAYDQIRDIGNAIGLKYMAFAPYGNSIEIMSTQQGGVATLSRWPLLRVRNRRLPAAHENPPDARVALFTTFQVSPDEELRVITTHLSWEPEHAQMRLLQIGLILDDLMQNQVVDPDSRLVVTGDMNAVETEPAIQLATECLQDSFRKVNPNQPGHTWTNSNPLTGRWPNKDRRLDYIFCSKGTRVHSSDLVLNHPAPVYPSDHFGVMAELEWSASAQHQAA